MSFIKIDKQNKFRDFNKSIKFMKFSKQNKRHKKIYIKKRIFFVNFRV